LNRQNVLLIFCSVCITALFLFVVSIGQLSPINDHMFLSNLFQGKAFSGYVDRGLGRFTPLASQEYAIGSRLLGPSATLFYAIHATKMAICAVLLLYCLKLTRAGTWTIFALWISVFFSIGFAHSSVVLQAGELNELLLTLVFILIILLRESSGLHATKLGRVIVATGAGALVIIFFYKEVAFVMALAFGASELLRYRRLRHARPPRYVLFLLTAAAAFVVFYIIWHGATLNGSYVKSHSVARWNVICAYAANDPVMIFVVLPLTCMRVLSIARKPSLHSVFDSLLIAACAYAATFIVLGMYSPYYFLPAYGFAVCGTGGILAQTTLKNARSIITFVCSMLAIGNSTASLSDLLQSKNVSQNHSEFINSISQWLWLNPREDSAPRNLVMVGVNPGNNIEILVSLDRFLSSEGIPAKSYKIVPAEPTDNPILSNAFGFKDAHGYKAQVGDVSIYNPYQGAPSQPPLRTPSDIQIFRSGSEHTIPRWTLWHWIRTCSRADDRCIAEIHESSLYTGYAAMLVARPAATGVPTSPLDAPSYRIGPLQLPERLRAGTTQQVNVLVQNTGKQTWPSEGPGNVVHLSYLWLDDKGTVALEGGRTVLPEPIQPKDAAEVPISVKVPSVRGEYTLVISPVQENITWFYQTDHDAPGASRRVEVFQSHLARFFE
jgi:hypothetical protein